MYVFNFISSLCQHVSVVVCAMVYNKTLVRNKLLCQAVRVCVCFTSSSPSMLSLRALRRMTNEEHVTFSDRGRMKQQHMGIYHP